MHPGCQAKGTRDTRQRRAVLRVFEGSAAHLSADEVYARVREDMPRISLSTVYRNLEVLARSGLLNCFTLANGTRKYERASEHHHHLVCISCGMATDIDECPLEHVLRDCAARNQFAAVRHSCEVYGYCSECQSSQSRREDRDPLQGEPGRHDAGYALSTRGRAGRPPSRRPNA